MVGSASSQTTIKSPEAFESYYIETLDGLFFAVKGMEHPLDRWIAVLRYAPDSKCGPRIKDGKRYRRLYRFPEQEKWLRESHPQYLAYDPVFRRTLQSVPRSAVGRIYNPERKLMELGCKPDKDALEEDTVAFLGLLRKEAAVPQTALGITGSLLIGMHTGRSDMDVVVFGEVHSVQVHRALFRILGRGVDKDLHRLDSKGMRNLYTERIPDTTMEFPDFAQLEMRKVNQGVFRTRSWFIRFVKDPRCTGNPYGAHRYHSLGRLKIQATIAEDRDAMFTPCRYGLADVRHCGGDPMSVPVEIVSFRGRFCDQAHRGERISATGTLERVQRKDGKIWHRLLLGNSPEDTMIPIR